MSKTSFIQKVLLLGFGLFLTVVFLEIGLRIAGTVVLQLQEKHNHLSLDKNEYRILCLGESTTALGGEDSYPSQLEMMLNKGLEKKKYTVINKGIISTTTSVILANLDSNLNRYKPRLVVLMMGINDRVYFKPSKTPLWLWKIYLQIQDLRVYKLIHLCYQHLTHRISEITKQDASEDVAKQSHDYQQTENGLKYLIAQEGQSFQGGLIKIQELLSQHKEDQAKQVLGSVQKSIATVSLASTILAQRYIQQGLFDEAKPYLEKALMLHPKGAYVYQGWGEFYLAQNKTEDAIQMFQKAISLDPDNGQLLVEIARAYRQLKSPQAFTFYVTYLELTKKDYWGYLELAQWLREDQHYAQSKEILQRAISQDSSFDQAYIDIAQIMDEQEQFPAEEQFLLKCISEKPRNFRFLQALGQLYEKQGKDELAKQYFKKAVENGMSQYSPLTWSNYDQVINKITHRGIQVIVMQYPVRSIDPLKDFIGTRHGVTFVENRVNFKQALMQGSFRDYFSDNFAYDFGHCTRLGNQLIAKNLVSVISGMLK